MITDYNALCEMTLEGLSNYCGRSINAGKCNCDSGYEDCKDCAVELTRQLILADKKQFEEES